MRLIILITVFVLINPLFICADGDRITLPWSTSFVCDEWSRDESNPNYARPIICSDDDDALNEGLANGFEGGCGTPAKWTQITTDANYSGGDGGRGQRVWYTYVTDGSNEGTSGLRIFPNTSYSEIWMRWYMRYTPSGETLWSRINYDKLMYIEMYPTSGSADIITEWQGPDTFKFGKQSMSSDSYTVENAGWATTMGNSNFESDGEWHYMEIHLKIDTNGSNGIVELWIDDETALYSNTSANLGGLDEGLTGFNEILLISNQENIESGACVAVDLDDVAISNTGYIGPIADQITFVVIGSGTTVSDGAKLQ